MEESLFDQPKKKTSQPKARIYTVRQVNTLIKTALEEKLPARLTVTGEISGFKRHSSGHCYFDLKDENTVLPMVMWKSAFGKLKFEPENGLAVLATGYVNVYPPQGKYQFYVDSMTPAGLGALQLAFEQMKNKLAAEGLFDEKHKKPLPKYPMRIGILTSKSGAALGDIVDSIYNRWPVAKLLLYDIPVQGEGAAEKIAKAIKDINKRNTTLKLDAIIIGRGGGSAEDLWAFNEEILAREIFASNIPVISAVGHEIDITIADLVADARASTPTKAGMIAVPDIKEVQANIDYLCENLTDKLRWMIQLGQQNVDELSFTLSDLMKDIFSAAKNTLSEFLEKILRIEPHRLLADKKIALNNVHNKIAEKINRILSNAKLQFETQAGKLFACSPKSVLNRGYSITKNAATGKVITDPSDVNIGDLVATELANEKTIESKVTKK
ncbi:MAG: exodeoxyribonuclease VII large subunit [Sedimentisphaerales bacterium]|nr:exodeoxyribonuclease VII large subunit [Sedimentisphaerales bacterium]